MRFAFASASDGALYGVGRPVFFLGDYMKDPGDNQHVGGIAIDHYRNRIAYI
jgi:hypothetical protein